MDIRKTFGMDKELAEAGVWVNLDEAGTRVKIAAFPNPDYDRYMEPVHRRHREMQKQVPESELEIAFARHVLLDWENVEENGAAVAPTEENRLRMLREYPAFKTLVRNEATTRANFQRRAAEAERKN